MATPKASAPHTPPPASALPVEHHSPHIPSMSAQAIEAQPRQDGLKAAARQHAQKEPSKRGKVTGGLAVAIRALIQDGAELGQAAMLGRMTTRKLRLALSKPHVIQWMKAEREVFREYVSASNIRRAREIRDAANNMPAMHAINYLDRNPEDEQTRRGAGMAQVAGFVIVLREGAAQSAPMLDVTPASSE